MGLDLDKYRVDKISESGLGILAIGDVEELEPLKISVVPQPRNIPTNSKFDSIQIENQVN